MISIFCLKSLVLALQLTLGQEAAQMMQAETSIGKIYTCPRCRRAKPPGPRKRPTPSPKKEEKKND